MSIDSLAWFLDVSKSYYPPPDIVYGSRSDWGMIQRCITSNAIWHQSFYGFVQLRVMSRTTVWVGFRSGANIGSRFEPPIAGVRGETVLRGLYEQISQTFISGCTVNLALDGTTFFRYRCTHGYSKGPQSVFQDESRESVHTLHVELSL